VLAAMNPAISSADNAIKSFILVSFAFSIFGDGSVE